MDPSKHTNTVEVPFTPKRGVVVREPINLKPSSAQAHKKQSEKQDNKFMVFVYVVLILAALMGGYILFTGPLSTLTHAVVPTAASEAMSTIYAYPLLIKADGVQESKIDIFVASSDSLPLANKQVTVNSTAGSMSPSTATTDEMGHVSYTLVLSEPTTAIITFSVNNIPFSKQITIKGE